MLVAPKWVWTYICFATSHESPHSLSTSRAPACDIFAAPQIVTPSMDQLNKVEEYRKRGSSLSAELVPYLAGLPMGCMMIAEYV